MTFFIFKKQRRFPVCIGGVMSLVDLLHLVRELIKGLGMCARACNSINDNIVTITINTLNAHDNTTTAPAQK